MADLSHAERQFQEVSTFQELVSTPFHGSTNALCWKRDIVGDFSEIVQKVVLTEPIVEFKLDQLRDLHLSQQGQQARDTLLRDMRLLESHGASPVLNLIQHYERDDFFFPTDVYSYHVDRSPVPTATFLCTYHGASSDILPNSQAEQKILIPSIRKQLEQLYEGPKTGFDAFLSEHFFDLHYQAKPTAHVINLGQGHLWKLAVDHPKSEVLPCVHRAPVENAGETRLMLIC